jgi:hypothetical protein
VADNKTILTIPASNFKVITDVVPNMPEVLTQALTPNAIRGGFRDAGFMTEDTDYPSYESLVSVYKGDLSLELEEILKKAMPEGLQEVISFGYINDSKAAALGVGPDMTPSGTPVAPRTDDQAEHLQRGRILTHEAIIAARDAALATKIASDPQKALLLSAKGDRRKELLQTTEEKLSETVGGDFSKLTVPALAKLNVDALQVFLSFRTWEDGIVPKTHKFPLKATLVQQCFELRSCEKKFSANPLALPLGAPAERLPPLMLRVKTLASSSAGSASDYYRNTSWFNLAQATLCGPDHVTLAGPTDDN